MTISFSSWATVIGGPAVSVATEIGVTVPATSPTYSVFPSGVMARAAGASPTVIGDRAVLVATVIGVTVREGPPTSSTYRVFPSGVMTMGPGPGPAPLIGAPARPVATAIGVTSPRAKLDRYRVLLSGVTAIHPSESEIP